ncbi:hypothetical protein CCP3SC15_1990006 [Gammaproteobacteria bacterium]
MARIALFLMMVTLAGCVATISPETHAELRSKAGMIRDMEVEQSEMAKRGEAPEAVLAMVEKARLKNAEVVGICADREKVPDYLVSICLSYQPHSYPRIAAMELTSARYFATRGDRETARGLYRQIILDHPGFYWESLRQAATFGLEDLDRRP